MENISDVSSEEELLQLRNEGKISEDEYKDLLATMQKTKKIDTEPTTSEIDKAKSKRKLGKIAFVLMLVGIILPTICFLVLEMLAQAHDANMHAAIGPWFFLGVAFEIAAFVMGVISWPDVFGKATVITISVLTVLLILLTR